MPCSRCLFQTLEEEEAGVYKLRRNYVLISEENKITVSYRVSYKP